MTNRERLMIAIRAKATEHYCLDLLERAIRLHWLTAVCKLMGEDQNLGQFLQSKAGKRFRRRSNWVLRI